MRMTGEFEGGRYEVVSVSTSKENGSAVTSEKGKGSLLDFTLISRAFQNYHLGSILARVRIYSRTFSKVISPSGEI